MFFLVVLCYNSLQHVKCSLQWFPWMIFFFILITNKSPCLPHFRNKGIQVCFSAKELLLGWMCIAHSPLHFKDFKSQGKLETGEVKRKKRIECLTVRQCWPFIQHTSGHKAVNKGSREKRNRSHFISAGTWQRNKSNTKVQWALQSSFHMQFVTSSAVHPLEGAGLGTPL